MGTVFWCLVVAFAVWAWTWLTLERNRYKKMSTERLKKIVANYTNSNKWDSNAQIKADFARAELHRRKAK